VKAVWYESIGEAEQVLNYGDLEDPQINDGEVLVKLKTSGVNPSDVKIRAGARGELQFSRIIPHSDGGGIIVKLVKGSVKIGLANEYGSGTVLLGELLAPVQN